MTTSTKTAGIKKHVQKVTSTFAKQEDGSIQITFTIPYPEVEKAQDKALIEIQKTTEIAGFRKGKAPKDKVKQSIDENRFLEATLKHILPDAFTQAIIKHKIKPATYPKFEIISAKPNETWQARAVTSQIGKVELGDYKKAVKGKLAAAKIWTPDKQKGDKEDNEPTQAEKEQAVIEALLESVKITIPKVLINDEVDRRLSGLLEKIEKLGLSLEAYLSSLNKTADELRIEYSSAANDSIKLELILNEIASKENITIDEKEVEGAITAASADKKLAQDLQNEEQKRLIRAVLKRRAVLESLVAIV